MRMDADKIQLFITIYPYQCPKISIDSFLSIFQTIVLDCHSPIPAFVGATLI
ncbi:hypothetical protein MNBD_CHLOROFLEXI01-70 [hydrothermal vent metagenome]|uniref:Uncharacterized protein n=1 Tax=hydrothermal vent metagenome TaxID=652676 RepID=A0A3B0UNV8_9ZZZZ